MQRVIAYIDGFNLYYGICEKKWYWAKWLNVQQMVGQLLRQDQSLVHVHYFTSIVTAPDKQRRQHTFLEALSTLPDFSVHYGHFLSSRSVVRSVGTRTSAMVRK